MLMPRMSCQAPWVLLPLGNACANNHCQLLGLLLQELTNVRAAAQPDREHANWEGTRGAPQNRFIQHSFGVHPI